MMKFTKILMIMGIALTLFSCEQKLPYPLDETIHGVVIDISKTPKTDMTLSAGVTTDKISLTLIIPEQQGDYSMLKEAEVMCIYEPASGARKSVIVKTGITSFPAIVSVDMPALCSALGITSPTIGDRMTFVPNVILKSGLTIPGWNPATGMYNNTAFTGWQVKVGVNTRAYQYRTRYTAYAPFYQEHYQGIITCIEDGDSYPVRVTPLSATDLPEDMPVGATASDLYGMLVEGIWDDGGVLKIWVNKLDFSLIIPDQIVIKAWSYLSYGKYDMIFHPIEGSFDINTLTNVISFTVETDWGPYTFGDVEYELHF